MSLQLFPFDAQRHGHDGAKDLAPDPGRKPGDKPTPQILGEHIEGRRGDLDRVGKLGQVAGLATEDPAGQSTQLLAVTLVIVVDEVEAFDAVEEGGQGSVDEPDDVEASVRPAALSGDEAFPFVLDPWRREGFGGGDQDQVLGLSHTFLQLRDPGPSTGEVGAVEEDGLRLKARGAQAGFEVALQRRDPVLVVVGVADESGVTFRHGGMITPWRRTRRATTT